MRSSVNTGASAAYCFSSAGPPAYKDNSSKASNAEDCRKSSATSGVDHARSRFASRASRGDEDAMKRTSPSPISQTVPLGKTDVNVAAIDRRSWSLML